MVRALAAVSVAAKVTAPRKAGFKTIAACDSGLGVGGCWSRCRRPIFQRLGRSKQDRKRRTGNSRSFSDGSKKGAVSRPDERGQKILGGRVGRFCKNCGSGCRARGWEDSEEVAEATGEAMFQALWRAEKAGSESVINVARQIQTIMQTGVDATFSRAVQKINAETAKLKNRTVVISTVHQTATVDAPARQHGGPVSAGRSYMVGEGGPEMFVPSQSGRIEPNGSRGSGVDAKALARAVADALEGTRMDVDGRQLGRLVSRHQPLAIAELGGRRR